MTPMRVARVRDAIAFYELVTGETMGMAIRWSDHLRDCLRLCRANGWQAIDIDQMREVAP